MAFSGVKDESHWVHMEIFEGSYGGRAGQDGMDAVDTLYANTRNNPIEDVESHLPLRVERYELREDAAAPAAGGAASARSESFRMLADGGVSVEGDGHRFRPWGLRGGGDGVVATLLHKPASGPERQMPSKVPHMAAMTGDVFIASGPGGGGYGDPLERAPGSVADDVADGLIDREAAQRDYGVVLDAAGLVDEAATAALRASRCGADAAA